MGAIDITNATGSGPGNIKCGWEVCKGHQTSIDYHDKANGKMTRGSLWNWPLPAPNPYQKITPLKARPSSYKFQRHHVVPVNVYKLSKIIAKNLELLGYNINKYPLNGICLPFEIDDLVWDDLQYHRGSHPIYNGLVRRRLNGIRSQCVNFCTQGDQTKLWDLIDEAVKEIIEEIQKWSILIHPTAQAEKSARNGITWI